MIRHSTWLVAVFAVLPLGSQEMLERDPFPLGAKARRMAECLQKLSREQSWEDLARLLAAIEAAPDSPLVMHPELPGVAVPLKTIGRGLALGIPDRFLAGLREPVESGARFLLDEWRTRPDPAILERIVRDHFYSSITDTALDLLSVRALEMNDARSAIRWGLQLLQEYPSTDLPRHLVAARIAHACTVDRNWSLLASIRAWAVEQNIDGVLRMDDREWRLLDLIDDLLGNRPDLPMPWWHIEPPVRGPEPAESRRAMDGDVVCSPGSKPSIARLVPGRILVYKPGTSEIRLVKIKPAARAPVDREAISRKSRRGVAMSPRGTILVNPADGDTTEEGAGCTAFNPRTGSENWTMGPAMRDLKAAWKITDPLRVVFGPPACVDRLVVSAGAITVGPEDEIAVVAMDEGTGKLAWALRFGGAIPSGYAPEITIHRDMILVGTNLGLVACIDAWNGRVKWISSYPRDILQGRRSATIRPIPYREFNPPVVAGDVVYVLPRDRAGIAAFRLDTGAAVGLPPAFVTGQAGRSRIHAAGPGRFLLESRDSLVVVDPSDYSVRTVGAQFGRFRLIEATGDEVILKTTGDPFKGTQGCHKVVRLGLERDDVLDEFDLPAAQPDATVFRDGDDYHLFTETLVTIRRDRYANPAMGEPWGMDLVSPRVLLARADYLWKAGRPVAATEFYARFLAFAGSDPELLEDVVRTEALVPPMLEALRSCPRESDRESAARWILTFAEKPVHRIEALLVLGDVTAASGKPLEAARTLLHVLDITGYRNATTPLSPDLKLGRRAAGTELRRLMMAESCRALVEGDALAEWRKVEKEAGPDVLVRFASRFPCTSSSGEALIRLAGGFEGETARGIFIELTLDMGRHLPPEIRKRLRDAVADRRGDMSGYAEEELGIVADSLK